MSPTNGPHYMPTFVESFSESGHLHHSSLACRSSGDGSSRRRNLESPCASHNHFTAYLPHHYHYQREQYFNPLLPSIPALSGFHAGATATYLQFSHSQPQIINGSATEAQNLTGYGNSHLYYHLMTKPCMHCISTDHEHPINVARRRTKSLPDLSTCIAIKTLDTSKPGTPVHCKPVLGEYTMEPLTTGYYPRNLVLLKQSSISADNIPATCLQDYPPSSHVKKGHHSKQAGRRSRPKWNYISQSGIEMDDESSSHHSGNSSSAGYHNEHMDSDDEGIGLWAMNQRSISHKKTPATSFRAQSPFRLRSKGAATQENIRRGLTTSRGSANKVLSSALSHRPIISHLSDLVPFMHGSSSLLPSVGHSRIQGSGHSRHPPAPYETVVTVHNGVVTETTEC